MKRKSLMKELPSFQAVLLSYRSVFLPMPCLFISFNNTSFVLILVACVQVGAQTETELKEKKLRVEDALNATKVSFNNVLLNLYTTTLVHRVSCTTIHHWNHLSYNRPLLRKALSLEVDAPYCGLLLKLMPSRTPLTMMSRR